MSDRGWYLIVVALFGVVLAVVVFGFAVSVAAQVQEEFFTEVSVSGVAYGSEGNWKLRAGPVAGPAAGLICDVRVAVGNGHSTHDDNDFRVLFGAGPVFQVDDFEAVAFGSIGPDTANNVAANGGPITVEVRYGPDRITSSEGTVLVRCLSEEELSTTTTTTPPDSSTTTLPTVTTTTPTTPPSVTTTTEPPPINGPNTGGGACADGACDGSLSPLVTWGLLIVVWLLLSSLAWAFIHGATRRHD